MVEPENIDSRDPNVKLATKPTVRGHNPIRLPSGKWIWDIVLGIELKLPDGRKLVVNETVRTRPKQIGRRPNPSAFGRSK